MNTCPRPMHEAMQSSPARSERRRTPPHLAEPGRLSAAPFLGFPPRSSATGSPVWPRPMVSRPPVRASTKSRFSTSATSTRAVIAARTRPPRWEALISTGIVIGSPAGPNPSVVYRGKPHPVLFPIDHAEWSEPGPKCRLQRAGPGVTADRTPAQPGLPHSCANHPRIKSSRRHRDSVTFWGQPTPAPHAVEAPNTAGALGVYRGKHPYRNAVTAVHWPIFYGLAA